MSIELAGGARRDPANRSDQLVAVPRSGFLGRLRAEQAAELVRSAQLISYPVGSLNAHVRDAPWAAIVISGVIRQYLPTAKGRQVTIRYARTGDLVGNSSVGGRAAGVEIEAVEASDLLHLDLLRWERIARIEPEVSIALVEELSDRLRQAYGVLTTNTFATVRSRVARDLLERAFETQAPPRPRAHLQVTHQALADATSSVREVVARVLRELRLQGIIQTDQSGITIVDFDGLVREAGQAI